MLRKFCRNERIRKMLNAICISVAALLIVAFFNNDLTVNAYTENENQMQNRLGAELSDNITASVKLKCNGEEIEYNSSVVEDQILTYAVTMKNNGTSIVDNLNFKALVKNAELQETANATINGELISFNLGELLPSEEKTIEYSVKVGKASNVYVMCNMEISSGNLEGYLRNMTYNEIKSAEMEVMYVLNSEVSEFSDGIELEFIANVKSKSQNTLTNVVLTQQLPEGLEYVQKEDSSITYDEQTRILTIRIDQIAAYNNFGKTIKLKTTLPSDRGEIRAESYITAKADNTSSYSSNKQIITIRGARLSIQLSSNVPNDSTIKEGTIVKFTATVMNYGEATAAGKTISINLPKEFLTEQAYCYKGGQTLSLSRSTKNGEYIITDIEKGETITLEVTAKAKVGTNDFKVNSKVYASVEEMLSNEYQYVIENSQEDMDEINNSGNSNNYISNTTHRIEGTAWLDSNQDGQLNSGEKLLDGISVMLIYADTGVIVTDDSGNIKQTQTSTTGKYSFKDILPGKYLVIFEYDSNEYNITSYKKDGTQSTVNSKAFEYKINKGGAVSIAGVTEPIIISNSNANYINIGLVDKNVFDMKIENTISKVVVENVNGAKIYENLGSLGKVEVQGAYLTFTRVYVEYKIRIKNNSTVDGYIGQVIDYMPPDMAFDEDANLDWYKGNDGKLYYKKLENKLLKAGEEKEVTLVLSKKMTEDNTGVISNVAEIKGQTNELNKKDYNTNNNVSTAEVIVAVKTGEVSLYITTIITLISVTIIALGIVFIKRKVLGGGI